MQYKTIVLELLQQHPEMHHRLRTNRLLLPTMEHYARQLKTDHEAWIDRLFQARAGRHQNQSQIVSEALELAIKELETALHNLSEENELLSIEEAMAFIRGRILPA